MGRFDFNLIRESKDSRIVLEKFLPIVPIVERFEKVPEHLQKLKGYDYDFYDQNGKKCKLELKIRYKDYGDLLVETISCTKTNSLGWIKACKADGLLYSLIINGKLKRIYVMNFPKLQTWWNDVGCLRDYDKKYGETQTDSGSLLYETENRVVPWDDLPRGIVVQIIE